MKILIVGTPRSGTTSLLNVLSNACKLNKVFEPFNYDIPNNYKFPFDLENSIVKLCPFQTPKEYGTHSDFFKFVKEYYLGFDKTILITRKDKDEHLISWHNSISKNQSEKKEDLSSPDLTLEEKQQMIMRQQQMQQTPSASIPQQPKAQPQSNIPKEEDDDLPF